MLRAGGKGGLRRAGRYLVRGEPAHKFNGRGRYRRSGGHRPRGGKRRIRRKLEGREGPRACRGSGVGQKLYAEIERLGRERGIENLISIITSDNEVSLRFHRKNGFTEIGVMPAVAFKFGKYLDVSFFQKHLG